MTSSSGVKNDLYPALSVEVRQELAEHEEKLTIPRGTSLVERGVASHHLIILNSGSVEISIPVGGKTLSMGVAGPGKVFALQSVLSGEKPHTSVTCLEECRITRISKEAFLAILERNPQMYLAIIKILSAELVSADDL